MDELLLLRDQSPSRHCPRLASRVLVPGPLSEQTAETTRSQESDAAVLRHRQGQENAPFFAPLPSSFPCVCCFHLGLRSTRCSFEISSLERFQFLFDLCSRHLRIAKRRLHRRRASEGDMPQIVGGLFQCPSSRKRAGSEIITQVMEVDSRNQSLLIWRCLQFERTEPMMQTSLSQPFAAL